MLGGIKMVTIHKINTLLKIAILIVFLVVLVEIRMFKLDNCDKCKLEVNNTLLSQGGLVNLYFDKCLSGYSSIKQTNDYTNITLNLTNIKI